ncbi:endolytic transglycosylase MltG [Lutibacter sp. B2]|nr:endolytic transglycosylase MltG [Lutibacter sp. B2]
MKSNTKIKFSVVIVLIFIMSIGTRYYFELQTMPFDSNNHKKITVDIPIGASTIKIGEILEENEIIRDKKVFRISCKLKKAEGKMKAGKYILTKAMSTKEIIDVLVLGQVGYNYIKFTIPEGFEFRQIVERLESKGLIDKKRFIEVADYGDLDYYFLKDIPKGKNRLEGYLFPDTYEVSKDVTEEALIKMMLDRFNTIFNKEYQEQLKTINMSMKDVIIMASIIEREAKLDSERSVVASVFYNRITRKIKLQSCATVQYALEKRKTKLSNKDTRIDSLYNTYKYTGLPLGPIASPGKASIEAALFPQKTDYLYFVVSKDGKHHFSKTYKEHLNAKNAN